MAEGQAEGPILDLLKTIQGQMVQLAEDNKQMKDKIKNLEGSNKIQPPSEDTCSDKTGEEPSEHAGTLQGFERSDSEEEGDEIDLQFLSRVKSAVQGPPVNASLAEKINEALLKVSDTQELLEIHDANPGPANIAALKVPEMNPEVKIPSPSPTAQKENELGLIQKDMVTAMAILTNILGDLGKKKNREMGREELFSKINEVVSVLAASHKSVSYARKLNVKFLLHEDLQVLCTKKSITEKKNNDLLFGEDMGKTAEEARKLRNLVMKTKSKNGLWASKRGRGSKRRGSYPLRGFNRNRYQNQNQNQNQRKEGQKSKDQQRR